MFPRDQAQPETVNPNESLIAGWAGGSILKNINDSILILYYFLENIKNNDNGNMGIKIFQKKERILWGKG